MHAERTTQVDVELDRDFGARRSVCAAFRQQVDDQLVTVFGADVQDFPARSSVTTWSAMPAMPTATGGNVCTPVHDSGRASTGR